MRCALLVILAIGCKSRDHATSDPGPAPARDAAPRPDASPRPDAIEIDAGPADARPYVEIAPCPYDTQELEAAARAVWGPPPDAGVVVQCVPLVAPDPARILYGYAPLDNRYEAHITVVKASPGHSVIADSYHRTTDASDVDEAHLADSFMVDDLDDDGIDELLERRGKIRQPYDAPYAETL